MNLQENIQRIKQVMGVISEDISIYDKRRIPYVQDLLKHTLLSSYPCDYNNLYHYTAGILLDLKETSEDFTSNGISFSDVENIISEYLIVEIKSHYLEAKKEC